MSYSSVNVCTMSVLSLEIASFAQIRLIDRLPSHCVMEGEIRPFLRGRALTDEAGVEAEVCRVVISVSLSPSSVHVLDHEAAAGTSHGQWL